MNEVKEIGSAKQSSSDLPTGADNRRRRIIVSAYLFSPVRGSEEGIGWNICSRLAAYHDVTVLTRSWNEKMWSEDEQHREEAERFMRDNGPIPGLTIHFVDSPPLSRLLQPHQHVSLRSPFYFQGYAAWQRAAYREAVRLHRERPFDVTHQLTTTSFREPGYLWKLDVPFIWGPTGGGGNIPWSYFADFGSHDRLYYTLKNIANRTHVWTKRRSRMAARHAERVLVNGAELNALMVRWGGTPHTMLDMGTPNWAGRPRCYDGARPLRLSWIGLHLGRKALSLFLRALAELERRGLGEKVHLTIMGTGPETHAWQALCQQLRIQGMTTWTGQVPFQQVRKALETQDALMMSSLQEGTPSVVMEALAAGLPVICHDIGGMSFAIDESCGFKIPLRDRQTSILEFADAIARLVTTQGLLNRLSEGALRRAKALSWDEKVREIANAYDAIPPVKADRGFIG
jgi:glycosyltransferase involved in cell wall biosynthesis